MEIVCESLAQFHIEIGERLVHQDQPRRWRYCRCHSDPRLLSPRSLVGKRPPRSRSPTNPSRRCGQRPSVVSARDDLPQAGQHQGKCRKGSASLLPFRCEFKYPNRQGVPFKGRSSRVRCKPIPWRKSRSVAREVTTQPTSGLGARRTRRGTRSWQRLGQCPRVTPCGGAVTEE